MFPLNPSKDSSKKAEAAAGFPQATSHGTTAARIARLSGATARETCLKQKAHGATGAFRSSVFSSAVTEDMLGGRRT